MLTRHSFVFQIIPWNWKPLINWSTAKCGKRNSFDTWYYIVLCATLCVSFHQNWIQLMFFQNIFWGRKHVINQFKQEIVLSRDNKELFVQRFVWVFDENRRHVEARNQRTRHPSWRYCTMVGLSEAATRGVLWERCS